MTDDTRDFKFDEFRVYRCDAGGCGTKETVAPGEAPKIKWRWVVLDAIPTTEQGINRMRFDSMRPPFQFCPICTHALFGPENTSEVDVEECREIMGYSKDSATYNKGAGVGRGQ